MSRHQIGALGRIPDSDIHGRHIFDAIREGSWPFKARTIHIFYDYDLDYNRYILYAEVWFSTYVIRKRVYMNRDDMLGYIDESVNKAAKEMLWAFRNREILPVPSNIELGEN